MKSLESRIDQRECRVGVVGLGYVGLPLAVEFARAGFDVVGLDLDAAKSGRVARGENYVDDVNADELRDLVARGRLTATSDWARAGDLDVVVICVPTPFNRNREPDLSAVTEATRAVARQLRAGQLVVLVIHTDHTAFAWDRIVPHCRLVLDTRNATHAVRENRGAIVKL